MMTNGTNCFSGGSSIMMLGGGLFMLLSLGLIIWLIIYAIRKLSPDNKKEQSNLAINVLKQRYSRGEISTEEYKERLQVLMDTNEQI